MPSRPTRSTTGLATEPSSWASTATAGSASTSDTTTYYDPVGSYVPEQTNTINESLLLIRTGPGAFSALSSAGPPTVTGTATSAFSSFTAVSSLSVDLTQVLTPVWNGSARIGTLLTQTYAIENPSASRSS